MRKSLLDKRSDSPIRCALWKVACGKRVRKARGKARLRKCDKDGIGSAWPDTCNKDGCGKDGRSNRMRMGMKSLTDQGK